MDSSVAHHVGGGTTHHKGISRIQSKTTNGWLVRGYKNGKRYSKLFSDRKFDSSEEALRRACIFQAQLDARLKAIPSDPRARKIVYRDIRNSTGVIGISKLKKAGKNGRILEFYSVTWRTPLGEQKCTSFSIGKYGENGAFKKAVICRFNALEGLHGRDIATRIVGESNVEKYILSSSDSDSEVEDGNRCTSDNPDYSYGVT
ncbi:MAG: hypothetical protein LBD33_02320 [Puniceicoccales bacterium]|jgi:hypothetical protein|nr:hypothetical protein [Puniceicoccales bacterium]